MQNQFPEYVNRRREETELTNEYYDYLSSKYNLLGNTHLTLVDYRPCLLETKLAAIKKEQYEPNDRFIIEHFDTAYYLPEFFYGIVLYNVIVAFKKLDIPLFVLLLVTNNFGVSAEIDLLAPDPIDRPTVISTFISIAHYTNNYQDMTIDVNDITMPGLCMLGQSRVHRNALYRLFKNNKLLDRIAVAIRPELQS
jgi:hypothetical protein